MSEPERSTHRNRLIIEGIVIVVSILMAFAIDAWWGNRQERTAETKQLARVSVEINTNAGRIRRKLETLVVAIDATSEFISWMGPEPGSVPHAELHGAWTKLYSIGTFTLTRGASEEFLAAGRIDTSRNADVRYALDEWYSLGDDLERQYDLLRAAHANVGVYLIDAVPMLHLDGANEVMADHPTSKFEFDQVAILSDPRFESRLSLYLIRLEFVTRQAQELLERQAGLLVLTELAADR